MKKIIHTSMAATENWTALVATCEDGTVWEKIFRIDGTSSGWLKLPDIPSDSDKNNVEIPATPERKKNTSTCKSCMGEYQTISICNTCHQLEDLDWNV